MRQLGFLSQDNNTQTAENKETLIVPTNFTHSIAIGQTGCGKTTSFIYPNLNHRIKEQHGILLFDYKGKEHAAVKLLAKNNKRLKDVIEIGVPWGAKINIIKYMNEAEIKKFSRAILGLGGQDEYWAITTNNIITSIWTLSKSYLDVISYAKSIGLEKMFEEKIKELKLSNSLTFRTFSEVTKSMKSIASFVKSIETLAIDFHYIVDDIIKDALKEMTKDDLKAQIEQLVGKIMSFRYKTKKSIKPLLVFKEVENESRQSTTIQTIILSLSTTLSTISELEEFNNDEIDLVKELNSGKIVIVNTASISSDVLGYFVGSMLQELSKRVSQKNVSDVSVFIDEAQRILNSGMDLHEDVLRENRVELFLATQNINLLINTLGENKFTALFQNLAHSYHFKNSLNYLDKKVSKLETFQYIKSNSTEVFTAEPSFLTNSKLFSAQVQHLKSNGVYKLLGIQADKKQIIVNNPYLHQNNMIQLESADGSSEIFTIKDKELNTKAIDYIDDIINSSITPYNEHEFEDEPEEEKEGITLSDQEKILKLFNKKIRAIESKNKFESKRKHSM